MYEAGGGLFGYRLMCHVWYLKWKKIEMLPYSNEEMNRAGRFAEIEGLLMISRPAMLIVG